MKAKWIIWISIKDLKWYIHVIEHKVALKKNVVDLNILTGKFPEICKPSHEPKQMCVSACIEKIVNKLGKDWGSTGQLLLSI